MRHSIPHGLGHVLTTAQKWNAEQRHEKKAQRESAGDHSKRHTQQSHTTNKQTEKNKEKTISDKSSRAQGIAAEICLQQGKREISRNMIRFY